MRKLLFVLCALALLGRAAEAKPNLIIINIDDLGYGDIGPFGSTTATPELDRMAREGRKLTSHYAAPVCSPSRAALMTGCYPKRVLAIANVLFSEASVGLNPEEMTIAEVLKQAGYDTACIGKWHLGDQPEFLPRRQGFDYYYGLPYSNDMGPLEDGPKNNPGQPTPKLKPLPANAPPTTDRDGRRRVQAPLPLLENDQVIGRVRAEQQFELTRLYTEKSVQFIQEHTKKPFFLYLAHTAVHFPHYPGKSYLGTSGKGLLADRVEEMDWSVGRVLATLRELKLDENTFVLFTSDNGGAIQYGSVNLPLRGAKNETWEGGIRTPTIAWWPKKIPAGTSTDAITSMMDVLPTFAHLAGAPLPANRKLDGVDIWPTLVGDIGPAPRDNFFYFRGFKLEAVRSGPWKLRLGSGELYQLVEDIGESNNVASAHEDVVADLRKLAATMENDLGTDGVGPGCRPMGHVEKPLPLIDDAGNVRADYSASQRSFP